MERESISDQFQIEQRLINNTVASLRTALDLKAEEQGAARKLSTIRFVVDSFHRHVERLMAINEHDGYMSYITNSNAEMVPAIKKLRQEHNDLREELGRIVTSLERLSPHNVGSVERAYDSLRALLNTYDDRSQREMHLVQEALLRDVGGEG